MDDSIDALVSWQDSSDYVKLALGCEKRNAGINECKLFHALLTSQGTFPNCQYSPTQFKKRLNGAGVTLTVAGNLMAPEFLSCARQLEQPTFVSVPKATVDEDTNVIFGKHNIWTARQIPPMKPKTEACGIQ